MASSRPPLAPSRQPITAQLVAVATALLLVFLAALLPQLLPLRLLDPAWQLRLCGVLAENGVLPLLALGLLFLASYLDPDNAIIRSLRERASRLAVWAALGFFLLAPLQLYAMAQASTRLDLRQQQQRHSAEERLTAIERSITTARSSAELQQRLQALQAPPLPEAEQSLPLAQLRPVLLQRLAQTRPLVQRSLARGEPIPLPARLLQAVRGVVSNLAYAFAFSACAFGPKPIGAKKHRSLLQRLLAVISGLLDRLPQRRAEPIDEERIP